MTALAGRYLAMGGHLGRMRSDKKTKVEGADGFGTDDAGVNALLAQLSAAFNTLKGARDALYAAPRAKVAAAADALVKVRAALRRGSSGAPLLSDACFPPSGDGPWEAFLLWEKKTSFSSPFPSPPTPFPSPPSGARGPPPGRRRRHPGDRPQALRGDPANLVAGRHLPPPRMEGDAGRHGGGGGERRGAREDLRRAHAVAPLAAGGHVGARDGGGAGARKPVAPRAPEGHRRPPPRRHAREPRGARARGERTLEGGEGGARSPPFRDAPH